MNFNIEMTSCLSAPRHATRHATGCDLQGSVSLVNLLKPIIVLDVGEVLSYLLRQQQATRLVREMKI
jgi:hypothetical protein